VSSKVSGRCFIETRAHAEERKPGVPSPSSGRLFGALNTMLSLQNEQN